MWVQSICSSLPEQLKIVRSDPLVGDEEMGFAHEFDEVGGTAFEGEGGLLLLLEVPDAEVLLAGEDEAVGIDLHDAVVLDILVFVLLHEEFEVAVVDEDGAVLLHDDVVVERVDERNCHLQLVLLLQSVLGVRVYFVDAELVLAQCVQLVVCAQLQLLDVCRQLVLSDLLGVEVEQSCLRLGLGSLSEEVVHFSLLGLLEGDDAVVGVKFDGVEQFAVNNFPLFDFFLLLLGEGRPPEDVLLDIALCVLVEDEEDAAVVAHDGGVDIDLVLQLEDCLLGHFLVLLEIVDLHLVVLLHLVLVFHFPADGRFQHQADLRVVDPQDLPDDFVGEVVDYEVFVVLPDDDRLLLQVDAHQLSAAGEVQVLHGIFVGFGVEEGFGVVFEFPAFHALVADAVVLVGFSVLGDDLFEEFLVVGEGADFLAALFGAEGDLVVADFGVGVAVDICDPGEFLDAVVSFLEFADGVDFEHVVGAAPEEVDLGGGVDGLDDGDFQAFLAALLELRQPHVHCLVPPLHLPRRPDLPAEHELVLALLVGCQHADVAVPRLHVLDHRFDFHGLDHLQLLHRHDVELVHAEHHYEFVVEGADFGAELVVLVQHLDRLAEDDAFQLVDEQQRAVDVQQVVAQDGRLVQRGTGTVALVRLPREPTLLFHDLTNMPTPTHQPNQNNKSNIPHPHTTPLKWGQ